MIRSRRHLRSYIADMVTAIEKIQKFSENVSYSEFLENEMLHDAIVRNFEILGESVKRVPFRFQKKFKMIPWKHMYALRNFIVHEYFDLDEEIIWEIIQTDLNKNHRDLKRILDDYNNFDAWS